MTREAGIDRPPSDMHVIEATQGPGREGRLQMNQRRGKEGRREGEEDDEGRRAANQLRCGAFVSLARVMCFMLEVSGVRS